MSLDAMPFDTQKIMAGLKDFQRKTVEHVFKRMYLAERRALRYLVADEVGLGKTLVAKGLIARSIEHLWRRSDRIDVIYICSNADIARQNINRLNVSGQNEFALATRITLLPLSIKDLKKDSQDRGTKLNFISFTPGTSFDMKSPMGMGDERALIFLMLQSAGWIKSETRARNVLRGHKQIDKFQAAIDWVKWVGVDNEINKSFGEALSNHTELLVDFQILCDAFPRHDSNVDSRISNLQKRHITELRRVLAHTCLKALEPDLIILDEFQRFKNLLNPDDDDPAAELAKSLFDYQSGQSLEDRARVLLLSATPYKMYTMAHECSEDDHYLDFVATLRFLQNDVGRTTATQEILASYRRQLLRIDSLDSEALKQTQRNLASSLSEVMVRTERLAATANRDGMLETQTAHTAGHLKVDDVHAFVQLQRVAKHLQQPDAIEYWKSSPYVLNFMESYKMKGAFIDHAERKREGEQLAGMLQNPANLFLPHDKIRKYGQVDFGNARLRELAAQVLDNGAWQALWLPPSMPYWELGEPFAGLARGGFTKRLVFSSWRVVPKAVATLLSYDVERRCYDFEQPAIREKRDRTEADPHSRETKRQLLKFSESDERLTGMPVLGMIFPCETLARELDPLRLFANAGKAPSAVELDSAAREKLEPLLRLLQPLSSPSKKADERWYWAAPILIDHLCELGCTLFTANSAASEWLEGYRLAEIWSGEETAEADDQATHWNDHVDEANKVFHGDFDLGMMPPDLGDVLLEMSFGGPGVMALRTLTRFADQKGCVTESTRTAAARLAFNMLRFFNGPEAIAIIRGRHADEPEPYWRRTMDYCREGCLQAALDEFAHHMVESKSLQDLDCEARIEGLSSHIADAMGIRTSALQADEIVINKSSVSALDFRLRTRFAVTFGQKENVEEEGSRKENVRDAFNSPFWPFVLVSTSVGQEGLDFHAYCHAIVHWNLPSNPLDLEQREGRIHRYKGHAVRKNIASKFGPRVFESATSDPWKRLFEAAKNDSPNDSDIRPYWIFEGDAKIERHVPAMPLSRDWQRFQDLRRTLVIYRMVFGQARQDDLLAHLSATLTETQLKEKVDSLCIDLSPTDDL